MELASLLRPLGVVAGPAAVLALVLLVGGLVTAGEDGLDTSPLATASSALLLVALLGIGATAVAALARLRGGRPGVAGAAIAVVGTVLVAGGGWAALFVLPALAAEAPEVLETGLAERRRRLHRVLRRLHRGLGVDRRGADPGARWCRPGWACWSRSAARWRSCRPRRRSGCWSSASPRACWPAGWRRPRPSAAPRSPPDRRIRAPPRTLLTGAWVGRTVDPLGHEAAGGRHDPSEARPLLLGCFLAVPLAACAGTPSVDETAAEAGISSAQGDGGGGSSSTDSADSGDGSGTDEGLRGETRVGRAATPTPTPAAVAVAVAVAVAAIRGRPATWRSSRSAA